MTSKSRAWGKGWRQVPGRWHPNLWGHVALAWSLGDRETGSQTVGCFVSPSFDGCL